MRPRIGRQSGFTLLEMLVATAMTALLAGSLYASLYIAFRARRTAIATTDTIRFGTQAMAIIESDLKLAMSPNNNSILVGAFLGQSGQQLGTSSGDELTFYAALSDYSAWPDASAPATGGLTLGGASLGGPSTGTPLIGNAAVKTDPPVGSAEIKKIDYILVKAADSDQMTLVRNVTDNLLALVVPDPRQEIICRGVHSFTVQYYDGAAWTPDWDSTQQLDNQGKPSLPIAVEVTLELDSPDKSSVSRLTRTILLPCSLLTPPTTEGLQ
jgi:prepilin-type N-terminal cleavage/methylation domain-containing protein